jgi:hypothetical protein
LNKIEGVVCNPVQGAMYAFPQIMLPPKAIAHAKVIRRFFLLLLIKILLIFFFCNKKEFKYGTRHVLLLGID